MEGIYAEPVKGGAPLSQEQSVFSFDLNEIVHFSKGQEIAEIKGISLEPNISIQSYSDYIAIRGVIELTGDYRREEAGEESLIDYEEFDSKRYVEQVTDLEGDDAQFQHRFPVEISVPAYRVQHSDDIKISVDAFDYELPNNNQLNLYATVQIYGINAERAIPEPDSLEDENKNELSTSQPEEIESEVEETALIDDQPILSDGDRDGVEEEDNEVRQELEETGYHMDQTDPDVFSHREEDISEIEQKQPDPETKQEDRVPSDNTAEEENEDDFYFEVTKKEQEELNDDREEAAETVSSKKEEAEPERWPFKEKTQTLAEFFGNEEPTQVESQTESSSSLSEAGHIYLESRNDESLDQEEENEDREAEERDVSYLSDLFRNADEERYAKMRICIVQDEDTIETIADRFEVSPLQLIKQNKLTEDFDVEPGQLLYIPFKK